MTNPIQLPSGASVALASPEPPQISAVPPAPSAVVILPVQGPQGPPGSGTAIFGETPSGTKDGVNAVFTTSQSYNAGSTVVCRNGLREQRGVGYTETTSTIVTFSTPPLSSDDITIDYLGS